MCAHLTRCSKGTCLVIQNSDVPPSTVWRTGAKYLPKCEDVPTSEHQLRLDRKWESLHTPPWSRLIPLETLCTCQCLQRYSCVTETATILVPCRMQDQRASAFTTDVLRTLGYHATHRHPESPTPTVPWSVSMCLSTRSNMLDGGQHMMSTQMILATAKEKHCVMLISAGRSSLATSARASATLTQNMRGLETFCTNIQQTGSCQYPPHVHGIRH